MPRCRRGVSPSLWGVVVAAGVVGLSLGTACRGRNLASAMAGTPTIEGQARCGVTKSQVRPLIIEWPSSDRGTLEGLVERGEGLVAVRYEGCNMELVRRCQVTGSYGFTAVEPKRDDQEFRSADELFAKIPLGAIELEAQLERHGTLSLEMTVVGQYEAARERVARSELRGDCDKATHVITAVTVGAFKLSSGAGARVSGGVNARVAGGGAGSSAERGFERSDGEPRSCVASEGDAPPDGCGSLLRLEVEPIREPGEVAALRDRRPCPRGSALVEGGRYRPSASRQASEVAIEDFCLDVDEVSAGAYADCAKAGPCSAAAMTVQAADLNEKQREVESEMCNGDRRVRGRHPVNCVTWDQAAAYCRAHGGRLPTEHEWEWAARGGVQERSYAWGEEEPGPSLLNACGRECTRYFEDRTGESWPGLYAGKDGAEGTAKVGTYGRGAGRGRIHDLAGNVWEWTASPEITKIPYHTQSETYEGGGEGRGAPDTGNRVVRGGSFLAAMDEEVRVTARELRSVKDRRADVGFRCAHNP